MANPLTTDPTGPILSLPPGYLAELIVKTRGVQAKEAEVDPDSGSNPVDDKMWDVLQDSRDDLTREEIREQIAGLTEREQAELVAGNAPLGLSQGQEPAVGRVGDSGDLRVLEGMAQVELDLCRVHVPEFEPGMSAEGAV